MSRPRSRECRSWPGCAWRSSKSRMRGVATDGPYSRADMRLGRWAEAGSRLMALDTPSMSNPSITIHRVSPGQIPVMVGLQELKLASMVHDAILNRWPMGAGQWALANGRWPMGAGQWALANGRWPMGAGQWALANGRWPMGAGQWALANGRWPMGAGQWALDHGG